MGYNCLAQELLLEAAMSGHSKWHNIRIKKQKVDQVRGKLFSRLSREITVAAKEGGGNPDGNARLRTAIERGREAGMPNDNIQRAIQRGTGEGGTISLETITYEGYAPGRVGVAMRPRSTVRRGGKDAKQVLQLMEELEDHDDVQRAYANFDIPEEILQQGGGGGQGRGPFPKQHRGP